MSSGWVKIIKLLELSHPFLIFHDWRKRQCLLIGRTLLWICVLSYHHVHMLPQPSFSMVMWSLLWSSILWDFFTLPHPSSKGVECTYQGMLSLVRSFLLHSNAFLSYLNIHILLNVNYLLLYFNIFRRSLSCAQAISRQGQGLQQQSLYQRNSAFGSNVVCCWWNKQRSNIVEVISIFFLSKLFLSYFVSFISYNKSYTIDMT